MKRKVTLLIGLSLILITLFLFGCSLSSVIYEGRLIGIENVDRTVTKIYFEDKEIIVENYNNHYGDKALILGDTYKLIEIRSPFGIFVALTREAK